MGASCSPQARCNCNGPCRGCGRHNLVELGEEKGTDEVQKETCETLATSSVLAPCKSETEEQTQGANFRQKHLSPASTQVPISENNLKDASGNRSDEENES